MTMQEARALLARIDSSDNLTDDMREDIRKALDSADESIGMSEKLDGIDGALAAFRNEFKQFQRDYVETALTAEGHAQDARRDGKAEFRHDRGDEERVERKEIFEEEDIR